MHDFIPDEDPLAHLNMHSAEISFRRLRDKIIAATLPKYEISRLEDLPEEYHDRFKADVYRALFEFCARQYHKECQEEKMDEKERTSPETTLEEILYKLAA